MSKKIYLWIILAVLLTAGFLIAKIRLADYSLSRAVACSPTELFSIICFAGILDSMNPCAFSVLLLTIGFLLSLETIERKRVLRIGAIFIAAVFVVYLLIGLGLLKVFTLFGVPRFMSRFGAIALMVFGLLEILPEIAPSFPIKLRIPAGAKPSIAKLIEKGSETTALLLGGLVGLTEFPCTGGPYLVVLTLLHDKTTFMTGFYYLLLYNLIFIIPLVVILFIASDKALIGKVDAWRKTNTKKFKLFAAICLVGLGFLLFFI
jgi:cytochrome c biogenesis protein CcdA